MCVLLNRNCVSNNIYCKKNYVDSIFSSCYVLYIRCYCVYLIDWWFVYIQAKEIFFYYFCRRIEEFTNTHYTLSHTKLNCKECSQSTSDVQTVFRKFCRALHQYTQMRLNITHTRLQTLCITLYYTDLVYCWLYVYRIVVHSRKRVEERGPFFGQFLYINSL